MAEPERQARDDEADRPSAEHLAEDPAAESAEADQFSVVSPVNFRPLNRDLRGRSAHDAAAISESALEIDDLDVDPVAIGDSPMSPEDMKIGSADSLADRSSIAAALLTAGSLFLLVWAAVGIGFLLLSLFGLVGDDGRNPGGLSIAAETAAAAWDAARRSSPWWRAPSGCP